MFTQFTACVSHDICAKLARNLGAWSTHFRKEIWGAWLRNSRSPQHTGILAYITGILAYQSIYSWEQVVLSRYIKLGLQPMAGQRSPGAPAGRDRRAGHPRSGHMKVG